LDRCVRLRRENEELRTGRNLLMHDIIKGYNEWAKTSSRIYNAACVHPERTLRESGISGHGHSSRPKKFGRPRRDGVAVDRLQRGAVVRLLVSSIGQ
jgi:hypothetical protein